MAKGQDVVVSSNPKGQFLEGIIGDTSKPGTVMQIKAATVPVGGRHTWIAAAVGTDGLPGIIAVLRPDHLQGKTITDAYVSGTRCFLYCPIAGEEVNVLLDEGAGTSNTIAIGDRFMLDAEDGICVPASGTPSSVPFIAMEAYTNVAGSQLTWCTFTGQ